MSVETSMVGYYAQRAREYERIYAKPERQHDLQLLREFVGRDFVSRDVLELACGTGYWTEVLAGVARSVTALDINEETLEIARAKPRAGRRVTFLRADAYQLPSFDRPFNAGLAVFWWSHIPKSRLHAFLVQFHRAFVTDATITFIDNVYVEGSSTPVSRRDTEGNTYQQRVLDDGGNHEVLKNFPTRQDLLDSLGELATDVHIEFLQYYWKLTYSPRASAES